MSDFEKIRDELVARKMPADAAEKVARSSAAKIARNRVSAALSHVNTARVSPTWEQSESTPKPTVVIGVRG